jgi:hypothetical protein
MGGFLFWTKGLEATMETPIDVSSQDEEFIVRFENCTMPPERFHHRDHVRLSWLYLQRYAPIEALSRVSEGIKRFATFHGKADRYHETITWAYFFLIRERVERVGLEQTWDEFAIDNEDLFNWKDSVLKLYYNEATLASDLARRTFLLPDRPDPSK